MNIRPTGARKSKPRHGSSRRRTIRRVAVRDTSFVVRRRDGKSGFRKHISAAWLPETRGKETPHPQPRLTSYARVHYNWATLIVVVSSNTSSWNAVAGRRRIYYRCRSGFPPSFRRGGATYQRLARARFRGGVTAYTYARARESASFRVWTARERTSHGKQIETH